MAQLLVRNLEPTVVKKLRLKAAKDGISMEEEHRRILRAVLKIPRAAKPTREKVLKDWLLAMPNVGRDADFARERSLPRKVDLGP